MKQQIQEVHDYFVGKILTGDYELISKTEHCAIIKIDENYDFQMWIANGFQYLKTWADTFMRLEIPFEKREIGFGLLMQKIEAKFAESDRLGKLAQLENLKKELGL